MPAEAQQPSGAALLLHEAFDALAEKYPGRPAVEDELGGAWTYTELRERSVQIAVGVQTLLDGPGAAADGRPPGASPTLALLMRRACPWVAAVLAASRLGAPSLSLSGDLGSKEEVERNREALVEHRPPILILDGGLRGAACAAPALEAAAAGRLQIVEVTALLDCSPPEWRQSAPLRCGGGGSPDDPLYLVYTGGTTSASKCVVVTHRMAVHELRVYPEISPVACTDRVLHQASAFWGATSLGIFDVAWACGGCLVLVEGRAGPAEVTKAIETHKVTIAGLVPSVLEAMEVDRCPSLRIVFTWGEALAPATIARWARRIALLDLLIASEYWLILFADHRAATSAAGATGASGAAGSADAVGFRPVPGARLTLLPPESEQGEAREGAGAADSGQQEVPLGEVGELFLAGPMVSHVGYADASRNAGAFLDLPVGPDRQPVRHFRTRDLARQRPDGSLEYCGRADGFAKVGGKWLDLAAVERQLKGAGCKEAALVWDERAKSRHAAVVLDGASESSAPLAAHVARLRSLLPKETHLHVLRELPHNPATGKVHRGALVRQVAEATPRRTRTAAERAAARVGLSLLCGLLLAARCGARGAALLSAGVRLAPGLLGGPGGVGPVPEGLPEGFVEQIRNFASWHRALSAATGGGGGRRPVGLLPDELAALPYIGLLWLDAPGSGLGPLQRLIEGPIGSMGAALLVCRFAGPLLRALLAAAGRRRAKLARGDRGWSWPFWLGLHHLLDEWCNKFWAVYSHTSPTEDDTNRVVEALLPHFKAFGRVHGEGGEPVAELQMCLDCHSWVPDGVLWQDPYFTTYFYCKPCFAVWEQKMIRKGRTLVPVQNYDTGQTMLRALSPAESDAAATAPGPDDGSSPQPPAKRFAAWTPQLDELDFAEYEVGIARKRLPTAVASVGKLGNGEAPQASAAATPMARVVERCTGLSAGDPTTSLSSLESLKVIALVSALRRELGLDLAAVDVARCASIGELESLCERASAEAGAAAETTNGARRAPPAATGSWAIFSIPRFWKAPVGWLIRLDEVPDQAAMRVACRALVQRHAALRAISYRTSGDEAVATLCNGASSILVALRALLQGRAPGFCAAAAEGLLASWPRVSEAPAEPEVTSHADSAHFEWHQIASDEELRRAAYLRARSRGFKSPASIAVLFLPGADATQDDQAFLHIAVNHAITDAACIIPMVTDLLELHRVALAAGARAGSEAGGGDREQACGEEGGGAPEAAAALAAAALPAAKNGLEIQEVRLRSAVTTPDPSAAGAGSDSALDVAFGQFRTRRRGYDHYVRLRSGACRVLEVATGVIGVPTDHLLVAAIAAAFGHSARMAEVKLSIIAPMRDARGEGQVVANLASTRHLSLWVGGGRSLFALALDLSSCLRQRDWGTSDLVNQNCDGIFINVRGLPRFDGARPVIEPVDVLRRPTKFVKNAIEMCADQEKPDQWTIWMGVRNEVDGGRFAREMRRAIWGLATDPLQSFCTEVSADTQPVWDVV